MKKRSKGLICIWLVVIMLVGMLPMNALAADGDEGSSTPRPNADLWTGTVPLREASDAQVGSGLKYVYIEPGKPLNEQQLAAIPEDTDLLSWVRWELASSGLVAVPPVEYPANYAVSESDLAGDCIFEPVFSNVQITAVNNFTPAVKVYAASDDTTPNAYAWSDEVENKTGLEYQWYKQTQADISYYSPEDVPTGGAEELQRFVYVSTSDGTLTGDAYKPILLMLELRSGDTLTVTPDGTDDVSIFRILGGTSVGICSGFTADAGTYRVTNDTSVTATYGVGILSDSGEPFTATVDVTAAVPVAGRTSASLLTGDPLTAGTYLCKVTYDSDSSKEYNHVYTAWSDPVEYSGNATVTHTNHCVCGKSTHSDVGDHDEAVPTDFTAITTETELRNAATTGGSVYLANDIALTSTINVTGNLNLCLNGHSIAPHANFTNGRAFKVESAVTFNLTDCGTTGAITGFKTTDIDGGAGVLLKNGAKFNMYGGSITGNTSYGSGGGISIYNGSVKVGLYGGSITGNTATGNGGGVFCRDYQTNIKIAGNPKVADNTNGTQASNCYQAYFQIVGPLANTAKFSFNDEGYNPSVPVTVAEYATGVTGDYESCFVHDKWTTYINVRTGAQINMYKAAKVAFNADGGSGSMDAQTVRLYTNTALNPNTFTPPTGKVFSHWSYYSGGGGERILDGGTIMLTSGNGVTLYAQWKNPTVNVTITVNPAVGGTVTGGGEVEKNSSVTLTATANEGYKFVNWTKGGVEVSTNARYTFTATEDAEYVANFVEAHEHKLCQTDNCTLDHNGSDAGTGHSDADKIEFTAVSTYDELVAAASTGGSYYLTADIELTGTITVVNGKTLNLCLNGKKLSYAGTGAVSIFKVEDGATLNITDCGTDTREGHIDSATKLWTEGTGDEGETAYNLTGGVITGGTGMKTDNWQTIHAGAIKNYGTVYIYGGNIAGNQAIDPYGGNGGAIFNATGSDLYVYGGSIVGNYADKSIIYNYKENNVVFTGNAVFAYNTLTKQYTLISSSTGYGSMEISGNASFSHNYGGTLVSACYEPMIVKGSASFTDNQVNEVISYYYYELIDGKDFRMDGSILMERNTKPNDGSLATDIYVSYNSNFMPDAMIVMTAPLTESYRVAFPWYLNGCVLAKGDGVNVVALGETDAEKFTDVAGRPIAAANDVVYAGCVILDQPTAGNNYTVTATGEPSYQWYVITKEDYAVTDETVDWHLDNYDSATGKWSGVSFFGAYCYFDTILYAGDVITLTFDDAAEGSVEFWDYNADISYPLTPGENNTYTFTAPSTAIYSLEISSGNSVNPVALDEDDEESTTVPALTASVYGTVPKLLAEQDDAQLDISELVSGTYVCKVTWLAEDYVLSSEYVDYHAHSYSYTASENVITEKCTCGHEATATLTAPTGNLTYDGVEKKATVAYSDGWQGGDLTVTYKNNINVGTASASVEKDGKTAVVTFGITKVDQTAPTGLGKTNETAAGKMDGTITGVTANMEYRKDGESSYSAINATSLSGLAAGKYFVRVKGDANRNPSPEVEVTIAAGEKLVVTYKADGKVVGTVEVEYGKDATAPEIPAKAGHTAAWDKDGKNITADTEINAVYTINKYTVTYKADGKVVKTVEVEHGKDATAPEIPAKAGHTAAWSADSKNITADTEINAVYTINKYTVTYKADGKVVKTVEVEHGKDATAPEIPAKEGYNDTAPKWDKDGKNITADTEINAVYTKNQPGEYADVTPDTNVGGGKVAEEIEELKEKVPFTQEEEKQIEYGADVEVWLEIKDISDSVSSEEKAKVEEKLGDADVALYLDIAMFKQVGENEASRLTQLGDRVQITFKLADSLINTDKDVTRTYSIIHVHDGKAEIITPVFDAATKTLTFETDRFSTYAVVYTDVENVPPTQETTPPAETPETSDSAQPIFWFACMTLSIFGIAVLLRDAKRRHAR